MHIICFDLLSRSSETKHLLVVDCQAERPNQRHTAVAGGGLLSLWTSVHTNAWGHRRRWWSVHTQTHTETHAHKYQHGHVTCYHLTHMQVNTEAHKYTIAGLYSLNSSRTHTHTHTQIPMSFLCPGVLLSIVVKPGAERPSFLLVLDARQMTELARASVNTIIPVTLHGTYKPRTP